MTSAIDALPVAPAPVGPATALVAGAAALTQGALMVAGVGVVGGVVVAVGVEEVLGAPGAQADVAMRATLVGLVALAALGGAGEALRVAAERMLRMRTALALARDEATMPPAVERDALARGPIGVLRGLLVGVASITGLCGLVVGGAGLSEGEGAMAFGGLAAVAVATACAVGAHRLGRARSWWSGALGTVRAAWPRFGASDVATGVALARTPGRRPRDERLVAARRMTRLDRTFLVVTVGAVLVAFAGVLLRQQCRTCAPVAYDPFGESVVDGVATVGLALVMLAAAAWLARAVVTWLVHAGLEVATLVRARRGRLERTAWLDRALAEPRSVELLGRALGVAAAVVAAPWIASGVSTDVLDVEPGVVAGLGDWVALGPLVAALSAGALVMGTAGVLATRAWRSRIHPLVDADPLGPVVAAPQRAGRSRR